MDAEIKHFRAMLEAKAGAEPGSVQAVFSTFGVVDSDGDIVLATAFTDGQPVPMTWAHQWTLPVGKGAVRVLDNAAMFDGAFFLETDAGAEAYKTVKAMGNLQEWSWGFRVIDAAFEQRDAQLIRVIKAAEVFEVSPVLVGAGVGTYTAAIKGHAVYADEGETVLATVEAFIGRSRSLADLRRKEGRVLSDANRKRLSSLLASLQAVETDIAELLSATEPAPKGVDVERLYIEFQHVRSQLAQMGL
jgi:HK97 family phage prohead protease